MGGASAGEWRLMIGGGLLLGLAFAGFALPVPRERADPALMPVEIVDGDTFRYAGETIRVADIDTPEMRGRCPYESALARQASDRMEALLAQGPFELKRIGRDRDRYGRRLRVVLRDGRSLGDQLVSEGLARTWAGRRQPWCA